MAFVSNVNTTTGTVGSPDNQYSRETTGAMSSTMKTYYDTELLENARPRLVFSQLGKKQFLPAGHGDSVQWRKWNTFEKATTPLFEGVIPTGKRFGQSAISVQVQQYGDYAAISDRLDLHAVDNVILGAAEEMGAAGGETADTLVRNELATGTSVLYADTLDENGQVSGTPSYRVELQHDNNRLTPDMVNKAYTFLKKQKAPFFDGNKYVAVIHPSVAYDLRSHPDWLEAHKYSQATEIFSGEIGELHGVRFIESTEAPVFRGAWFSHLNAAVLPISSYSTSANDAYCSKGQVTPNKLIPATSFDSTAGGLLLGRKLGIQSSGGTLYGTAVVMGISGGSSCAIYLDSFPAGVPANSTLQLIPAEGGDATDGPCAVYATLFFGKDAFGVVDPEGMGMEMIIKDAATIGGPLNQFSTVGYKFESAAKILYENRMVRVESCSAYSLADEAN